MEWNFLSTDQVEGTHRWYCDWVVNREGGRANGFRAISKLIQWVFGSLRGSKRKINSTKHEQKIDRKFVLFENGVKNTANLNCGRSSCCFIFFDLFWFILKGFSTFIGMLKSDEEAIKWTLKSIYIYTSSSRPRMEMNNRDRNAN